MKLKNNIDKLGTIGMFFTALLSPCCFPLFAFVASALGLGSFVLFGGWTMWIFQWMVLLSVCGFYLSYFLYTGMFGLLIATIVNYHRNKLHYGCNTCTMYNGKSVELKSKITCPHCGHKKEEMMPTDACQFFYECENCKKIVKPKQGDCCVYCSYGTVKCPPIQSGEKCC